MSCLDGKGECTFDCKSVRTSCVKKAVDAAKHEIKMDFKNKRIGLKLTASDNVCEGIAYMVDNSDSHGFFWVTIPSYEEMYNFLDSDNLLIH